MTYDYRQASSAAEVHRLCVKYLKMLGVDSLFPTIKVRDNLGSLWLGRATYKVVAKTCLVEIQKSVLGDQTTLERVVAHEMCHVAEYANITEETVAGIRAGLGRAEHGSEFMHYAAIINAHMGAGWVSITSDSRDREETNTKPFTLLIGPIDYFKDKPEKLGYAVGVRLSPAMTRYLERARAEYKARAIVVTDAQWARGPKIGKGWAAPKGGQEAELWKLYEAAR